MKSPSSPDPRDAAALRGAEVHRHMLADAVALADDERRVLAAYLRSCGTSPITAPGKITVPSPTSVRR
jgi:hypothetical protein